MEGCWRARETTGLVTLKVVERLVVSDSKAEQESEERSSSSLKSEFVTEVNVDSAASNSAAAILGFGASCVSAAARSVWSSTYFHNDMSMLLANIKANAIYLTVKRLNQVHQ